MTVSVTVTRMLYTPVDPSTVAGSMSVGEAWLGIELNTEEVEFLDCHWYVRGELSPNEIASAVKLREFDRGTVLWYVRKLTAGISTDWTRITVVAAALRNYLCTPPHAKINKKKK